MPLLWHLALECSSVGGSVALLGIAPSAAEPQLHSQNVLPADRGSVCSLSPAIDRLFRDASLTVSDLECLSVTAGPGSFTGLRVGLATAKMLAMACQKPVVPVDTLGAIAQRFLREYASQLGRPVRLVTCLNAFRGQVFTASWLLDEAGVTNLRSACVVDAQAWTAHPWGAETPGAPDRRQQSGEEKAEGEETVEDVWISGPGLSVYRPAASMPYHLAPEPLWQPLAEDVGTLGWQAYGQGKGVSAAELAPNYIRSSAAEEKRRASTTA